jgi:class 3 adenylate cyclase
MPNLKQQINLKNKYSATLSDLKPNRLKTIVEAFDKNKIEKSFSYTDDTVKKYIEYFKHRQKEDVVLLFIDVASFSVQFATKTTDEIADYLDEYYDRVIPSIYKYGGEVEKIIGDGIICVFGKPFLELESLQLHRMAELCSMEIISQLKDTIYESKIAFHYGEIMYYHNDTDEYSDFTMVGSALTELFRLESVSSFNCINFYCNTFYEQLNQQDVAVAKSTNSSSNASWTLLSPENINLKGVAYSKMRQLRRN